MRRRFLLIDNAASGFGSRALVGQVAAIMKQHGASIDRCPEGTKDEAFALAARAGLGGAYDAIVAAGGDGTVRQVARALAGSDTPVGLIPLGTGNVLAHEIGLGRGPEKLAALLLHGRAAPVMAPHANGELFLLMAGAGFDGRVINALSHDIKGRLGKLAYVRPVLGALMHPPDVLDVLVDGVRYEAGWVVLANARHYGGAFVIAREASLHAPGLKAVLFRGQGRQQLLSSLLALASGTLASNRYVTVIDCDSAEIRSHAPIPVQVDGDAFGITPLRIEAARQRVMLIVPEADATKR